MKVITVTKKFQITIPQDIREKEGIHIGDKVSITYEDDKIVIKKVSGSLVEDASGTWDWDIDGVTFENEIRKDWSQ